MEEGWVLRLLDSPDRPLGACFLTEYTRCLRLLFGMCNRGLVRSIARARFVQMDQQARVGLLALPQVQDFLSFLREFPQDQLPVVFETIGSALFPDAEGPGLFRAAAAAVDPLRSPYQALDTAVQDLRMAEGLLPQGYVVPTRLSRPLTRTAWDSEAYTDVVTGVGREPVDDTYAPYVPGIGLPSAVAGVAGPGNFQVLAHQEPFVLAVHPVFPQVKSRRRKRRHQPEDVQTIASTVESQSVLPVVGVATEASQPVARAFDPEEVEEIVEEPMPPVSAAAIGPTEAPLPKQDEKPTRGRTPNVSSEPQVSTRTKRSSTPRKRKSRWDPEEVPQAVDRTARLQFVFVPPSGLPKEAIPGLTKVVSTLQGVLKNFTTNQIDMVITTKDKDPFLYPAVQNFGLVLQQFALQSRLSLLSYGKAWIIRYVDQESSPESVTLFMHVDMVQRYAPNEPAVGPSWKNPPPRSRSPPFKPSPGAASSDKKVPPQGRVSKASARPVFGSGKRHGTEPPVCADAEAAVVAMEPATLPDSTVPGSTLQTGPEAMEISPTIPFNITSMEGTTDEQKPEFDFVIPPDLPEGTHSNWTLFYKDGRKMGNGDWFGMQLPGVQEVLRGSEVSAIFPAIRDCQLMPIGGFYGCTIVGPSCRFQVAKEELVPVAVDARAYKVCPICPQCFALFPLQDEIFECPKCQGNLRSFRLPPPETLPGSQVERLFQQFRTSHDVIATHSGWYNLAFHVLEIHCGFWLVQGPTMIFWVLFPSSMDCWIRPAVGQHYFLYQASCVGFVQGSHVFLVPHPNGQGALVRQHGPQDSPRALELFAGIGGWHQARKAMGKSGVDILSLEIDTDTARALALSTGRPCYDLSQWLSEPDLTDAVVVTDIRHHAWWITTLVHPFSELMFSAPCTPWSTAGKQRGLHDHEGVLMLWAAAYVVLFQIDWAAGENVPGLLQHPHWPQVLDIFQSTGLQIQVHTHDLAEFGVMHRKRCFVTLTSDPPLAWPQAPCSSNVGDAGILMPRYNEARTQVPTEALKLLSQRRLLPTSLLEQAHSQGLEDGRDILKLRVHKAGPLPTLVASYRQQSKLDLRHLEDKGLFTWLLDVHEPRFLDVFEGLRALGFSPTVHLPDSLDAGMRAVGNSLSPLQALLVLRTIPVDYMFREPQALNDVMQLWLSGFTPLVKCRPLNFGDFSRLVLASLPRTLDFRWLSHVAASCDGVVFPISQSSTCSNQNPTNAQALPLGPPWQILEVGRSFAEDALLLVFRVRPLRLTFDHAGEVKNCLVSPFSRWRTLQDILKIPALLDGDLDCPQWLVQKNVDVTLPLSPGSLKWNAKETFFTAGTDLRVWRHEEDCTFEDVANLLFPHCARNGVSVQSADTLEFLSIQEEPLPGKSYRFYFMPIRIDLAPRGAVMVDPLSTIAQLEDLVNFSYYNGKANVRIVLNGRLPQRDLHVVLANQLGVLRVRCYALRGGAWTLNTVTEELQTLLVQHGHPASEVAEQANLLIDKFGAKQCKSWLDGKNPWATFKTEATKAKVVLIPPEARGQARGSQDSSDFDPWRNWKQNADSQVVGPKRRKPERKQTFQSKIDFSFFHTQGSPVSSLELPQLLQGTPGVHATTLTDFQAHLDSVLNANVCLGAAAVLLVGSCAADVSSSSSTRVKDVIVPGWLGSHSAALKAAMIQVGDVQVETHSMDALSVQQAQSPHQVVQIHVYKSECDKWDLLAGDGLEPFLKHLGFVHLSTVNQMWACDFYSRGKRVSPENAVYFHAFLKMDQAKVDTLLKLGGLSGFYPGPRSSTRGPDPRFRSILLRGLSLPEARKYQATVATAVGLTKTKQGLGLRVPASEYAAIKKKLFPQVVESSDSDEGGARKFLLLGIPKEVTRSGLKLALKALSWQARVSRASGFRAWSVFSSSDPPTRSFPLQGQIVIISEQTAVSTGTVTGTTLRKLPHQVAVKQDTIAAVQATFPTTMMTQIEEKSAAKISALEQRMDALTAQVAENHKEVSTKVQQVTQEFQTIETKLGSQLEGMFSKFMECQNKNFAELESTNKAAVTALRNEYQTGYSEIKELLSNSPKTRRVDTPAVP